MPAPVAPPEPRAGSLHAADGVRLHYAAWEVTNPRAVLLLSHGLGEHAGRYAPLAAELAARGVSVYAPDHRGHGRSEGTRGHCERFAAFAQDFEAFRREVASSVGSGVPVFLLGHSLGGLIAVRYLQTHAHAPLRGAVLSSPLLGVHDRAPRWKTGLAGVLSRLLPALRLSNEIDAAELTHDPAHVEAYRTDALVHAWITPRMYTEMMDALHLAFAERDRLRLPLLFVVPDADSVVRSDDTLRFAEGIPGDVTVKVYEGMYHETLNELERARVMADVGDWIDARIA